MTRKIVLENVQVGCHGELSAKMVDGSGGEEGKEFIAMHHNMNVHFDNDQMSSIVPYHPYAGQVCVGKVGGVWHRIRIEGIMSLKVGLYASCFLIDEGKTDKVPVPNLREIPSRFAEVPHQIKQLQLHGIKPLSLRISPEDLMVYERSVMKWDSSAVKFMSDYINVAVTVKVKVVSHHPTGLYSVIMYLYTRTGNRVCLNDALVDQRYAVPLDQDDTPTLPIQKHRPTTQNSLAALGLSRLQNRGTRTLNSHDHATSDIERITKKDIIYDRSCITDTEAVSAVSHKFFPRASRQSTERQGTDPSLGSMALGDSHRRLDHDPPFHLVGNSPETINMHQRNPVESSNVHSSLTDFVRSSSFSSNCGSETESFTKRRLQCAMSSHTPGVGPDRQTNQDLTSHQYKGASDLHKQSNTQRNSSQNFTSPTADSHTSGLQSINKIPSSTSSKLACGRGFSLFNTNHVSNTELSSSGISRSQSTVQTPPKLQGQSIGRGMFSSSISSTEKSAQSSAGPTPSLGRGSFISSPSHTNRFEDVKSSPAERSGGGILSSQGENVPGRFQDISPCPSHVIGRGSLISGDRLTDSFECSQSSPSPAHGAGRGSPVLGRGALLKSLSPSDTGSLSSPSGLNSRNDNYSDNNAVRRELLAPVSVTDVLPHRNSTSPGVDTHRLNIHRKNDFPTQNQSDLYNLHAKPKISESELLKQHTSDDSRNSVGKTYYTSGNESSASCMSAMAASVTGQLGSFTKSKLPRQSGDQDMVFRTSSLVSEPEKPQIPLTTDPVVKEKSPQKSPLKPVTRPYTSSSDSDPPPSLSNRSKPVERSNNSDVSRQAASRHMDMDSLLATSRRQPGDTPTDVKTEMLAKFSGEKLLKELSSGVAGMSKTTARVDEAAQKKKTEVVGMVDNVLVHGKSLKKPVMKIDGFPFNDVVFKHWETNRFASPKLVQSYGWPVVISGRHITAISPAGSGKTLTYLYALITYLSGSNMYQDLPTGMGPIVVILSKSWRRAEQVNYTVSQVLSGRKAKALLVYGGGMEENRAFELINGCDILVTTPPSLKRLLEKGYTDLRRLCHLVIDDCDQILDTFHVEINYIKSEYSMVIQSEVKLLECPRQILLFGSQWNEVNSQFTENVLNDPILLLTSPFEAAIYGRVRQIPHFCRDDCRLETMLGLLMNLVNTEHRIIIFTSSDDDVHLVIKGLRAYCYDFKVVTKQMELHDVHLVANDWTRGAKLLVCCDTQVMNMNITNATVVFHFDLPNSKTKFGNRMSCLRELFYNFASRKKRSIDPVSHLLITGNCGPQVRTIQELLKRSKIEIPKQLKDFLAGLAEQRETDDEKELCYQLLAYGTCRDKWKCGCRHVVVPSIDNPPNTEWLPNEGHVKVLVTHVNDSDASHFYVRLLTVKGEDGTKSEPALTYASLVIDLESFYKRMQNQKRHTTPVPGELCGYQDRGVFYRVQILDIPNMNEQGNGSIEASVKFVDVGKDMDVDVYKLFELPVHLKTVPFQAVEVFVCRVKPVDKDPEWTIKASISINELLYGKELEGKVVLRLGGILWLDPLVERVQLGETRAIINRSYVHVELVRNGFASENPTHLDKLYKLCAGKVELPRLLLVKTKMSQILQTDSLPLCKQYHDVFVSSVTSPDLFFIQRREKLSELDTLMDGIALFVHDLEEDDCIKEMERGQFCLAQYVSYDQRWYRARVMEVFENEYEIFFADYGDLDTVPKEKVKEFPVDKFFEFPLQAIECKLNGVDTDKSDEKKSGDAFWDLTHFINSDLKSLVVKVKSQCSAEFAGRFRFVIDMFDTNRSEDLNVAQELVYRQLVCKSQDSDLEDLVPKPAGLRRKIYSSPMGKATDLAAMLYWEKDLTKSSDIAQQLQNLIQSSVSRTSESIDPDTLSTLHCLIKLKGHVQTVRMEAGLETCILEILNTGERMCEEFLQSSCLSTVIRCLEMENEPSMQSQAAEFISSLCTSSTKIRNELQNQRPNILFTLNELFEYTQTEEVKGSVCKAFTSLCSGSDRVVQFLMEKNVCSKLKTILLESENHVVQESVILLLTALSDHEGSHSDLKKDSLIEAIVKILRSTECDKCIQHSIEFCAHYASTRRKHKTHLLELEMVSILNRMIKLNIQPTTKQPCKDLLSSLVVKFPSEPMSGVQHIDDKNIGTSKKEVTPNVHWCQTTFVVQLSVRIPEAVCNVDSFTFTDQAVILRDTVNGTRYGFHLELFDRITPSKCKVAVKPKEVLVSLHKHVKGKWARLLRGKQKPNWIFVDYERYVDSSSDSETYDEERPFVFKKKKKTKKLPTDRSGASAYNVLSSEHSDDSANYFDDPHDKDEFDIFA